MANLPDVSVNSDTTSRILQLADQCVMCGLCVPHCPTYRVKQEESESPRGRIALARGMASGQLDPTTVGITYLDHCLSCMSCERVCPSEVKYGQLIEETRALLWPLRPLSQRWSWIRQLMSGPRLLRTTVRWARALGFNHWRNSGWMNWLLQQFGLSELSRELPFLPALKRWRVRNVNPTTSRGRVGLFLGCVASIFEQDTIQAAIHLLTALGYEVVIPLEQSCCGALAKHAGDRKSAANIAISTCRTFESHALDIVLVSASGCFSTLRDNVFADTHVRVQEIHAFLAAAPEWQRLRFHPLPRKAALHTPCTQTNVAKAEKDIFKLLSSIPDLSITHLPLEPRCCGAAGSYFLEYPDIANKLRTEKLDQANALSPDMLITTNVGCRIYLGNGLCQRNKEFPVLHPLVVLAEQLIAR